MTDGRKAIGRCVLDGCGAWAYKRLGVSAPWKGRRIPRQLSAYSRTAEAHQDRMSMLTLCGSHFMRAYRAQRRGEPFHMLFETVRSREGLTDADLRFISRARHRMTADEIADELSVSVRLVRRRIQRGGYQRWDDEGRYNPFLIVEWPWPD